MNISTALDNRKIHEIYYEWHIDIRAGGPTGYLANLLNGLNRVENPAESIIWFNCLEKPVAQPVSQKTPKPNINDTAKNLLNFLQNQNLMKADNWQFNRVNLDRVKSVHVHTVTDVMKVKHSLREFGKADIPVILTCHTPEPLSQENYNSYIEDGMEETMAAKIKQSWEKIERRALELTDIIIFPSKEAMEPMLYGLSGMDKIFANKDIRFVETGAKPLSSSLSVNEAKKKYGVKGKFVIGYMGRHIAVKGYDILKETAAKVLEKRDDIVFLIGGSQGNTFPPLNHHNWIEAGWVDPADMFRALDVFALPNRMTYYDLVLIEAMSMGVPVIASNTGGNKSVQNTTKVLSLFENNAEALEEMLIEMINKTPEEIEKTGRDTKAAYQNFFTPEHFARRYVKTIDDIYKDYKL